MGWQCHQLGHMQIVCISTDSHTSTLSVNFYGLNALPSAKSTASKHWRQITGAKVAENWKWNGNVTLACVNGKAVSRSHAELSKLSVVPISLFVGGVCHLLTNNAVWMCMKAYLKGTELGDTVDQVESLIKKHDAFESLLATQDAKVRVFLAWKRPTCNVIGGTVSEISSAKVSRCRRRFLARLVIGAAHWCFSFDGQGMTSY